MATFNKFDQFVADVYRGVHDFSSDSFKVALTDTAPDAADEVLTDITEVANGNGYTSGGVAAVVSSEGQVSGTYKVVMTDAVVTATGGSVGPFRYAVLYNDTPTSPADPLVGWWDRGSSITLADGENVTIDFDATNGVFTAA